MLSKKSYELIAQVMRETEPQPGQGIIETAQRTQWLGVIVELSKVLAADNPRFDKSRFFAACKREEDTNKG